MTAEYGFYVLVSVLLPIAVAYFTKATWAGKYKAYLLLALASINSFVLQIQEVWGSSGFTADTFLNFLVGAVISFVIAAATHAGLLKPAGISGSESSVAQHGVTDKPGN